MALDSCGKDFAAIARIMATKTESMIRDFYNKYNNRFGLDAFVNKENTEPKVKEEEEKVAVVRESLVEFSEDGVENEVDQNEDAQSLEPPLIITTPQQRRPQSALGFPQNPIVNLAPPISTFLKEEKVEEETNAELSATKMEEIKVEIVATEMRKDNDFAMAVEVPKSRRTKTRKEPPARRVSTRSQSSTPPIAAAKRRRSRISENETPTRRLKSLSSSMEPPAKPRGRPPGKTTRKIRDSSASMQSSKGGKGNCKSTKAKVKESPAVAPKRRSSLNSQELSEAPKKRGRNSSTSPHPNRLRR